MTSSYANPALRQRKRSYLQTHDPMPKRHGDLFEPRARAYVGRARPILVALFAASATAAATSTACTTEEPGPTCVADGTPPGFSAAGPAVSFSRDVIPIFETSCAFSTCHGSNVGAANGVFLGNDPARVHAALVGVRSGQLPSMAFVAPGAPQESYLLRKIDGSQCALDDACGGSCGDPMPRGADLLPQETRDVVRSWIAQGAKND